MIHENTMEKCSRLIAQHKLTIAFAESASAGKLAFAFSLTGYSGDILKGGLVCYHVSVKEDILGVPKEFIQKYTPESAEVTREMALRLKNLMDADIIVAVTGLTTPGGSEGPEKPVGTMFYCVILDDQMVEVENVFKGTPTQIIDLTIIQITNTIIDVLNTQYGK